MACDICGETFTLMDAEHGHVAEMFDPKDPVAESGTVHVSCGTAKGWELA